MKNSEAKSFKSRENLLGYSRLGGWTNRDRAELTNQKTSWEMITITYKE